MIGTTVPMVVDLVTILHGYGGYVVDTIRQNLASTGTNATFRTSKSVKYEVKQEGTKTRLKVTGKPFFTVVETGRKATPQFTKPSYSFVQDIKEWAKARGIPEGAAYSIAKSIHKKGTPPTGKMIFSNVVDDSLTDRITKDVLAKFAGALVNNIKQVYASNSN